MKVLRKYTIDALLFLCVFLICGTGGVAAAKKCSQWFTNESGAVFYYDEKGQILKNGIRKIDQKQYCFDAKGHQLVGWQKINSEYYYFQIGKGKNAYMETGVTVNGIKINNKGIADRKSGRNKRKLAVMVSANKILESLTEYSLKYSKREKLRLCFDYTKKKYRSYNIGSFRNSSTWDLYYAERVILPKDKRYRADCYTYGCAMAYLANACGAKAACVSSGGHGWAEVDGYVCDANWAKVDKKHNYFMRSYNKHESGTPAYKSARYYVKKI